MTNAPKITLFDKQTISELAHLISAVFHEECTEQAVEQHFDACKIDGEISTFKIGRMLRSTFDDTIDKLPHFWSDEERLKLALTGAYEFDRKGTLKKFDNCLKLVDILLHNDQMGDKEVRKTFSNDYPDSIITEKQIVDSLVNTALFRQVETGEASPTVWNCLRTYCTLMLYTQGRPISVYTKTKISSLAHDEKSPNAEMAGDLMRTIQTGRLSSAPKPQPVVC